MKIKMNRGGMAKRKLKDMEAALSFSRISLDWSNEKAITSYKGTPSNPGSMMCLDQLVNVFTGLLSKINRCNFIIAYD